jgi:hypothetical protein
MLNILAKLNLIYDRMKEPKRFITGVVFIVFPLIIFSGKAELTACIWVAAIIVVRIWWIHGNLSKYL